MRRVTMPTALTFIGAGSPTAEVLDSDTIKLQRRISTAVTSLDPLFDIWSPAAREYLEGMTGRQCLTATWEYWLAGFPIDPLIEMPLPPLQTIESVKYDDTNGDEQTLDSSLYTVEAPTGVYCPPGRLVLKPSVVWPQTVCDERYAVRVQFTAGYGATADQVPPLVRAALLYLVGNFHKYSEDIQEPRSGAMQNLPIGAASIIHEMKYRALPVHPPMRGCW